MAGEIEYGTPLTSRELDLVGQLLRGEIDFRIGAIRRRFGKIYRKLGVTDSYELVCRAYQEGAFYLLTGEESPAERANKLAMAELEARNAEAPLICVREQFARFGKVPDTPFNRKALGLRA